MTTIAKISAIYDRLYMLDSDGKLWVRSDFRCIWDPIQGPERDGETLPIKDFTVGWSEYEREMGAETLLYVIVADGRLFEEIPKNRFTTEGAWSEIGPPRDGVVS